MDTKKIIVLGAMAVLGFVVFTGVRKLGTPAPTSQAEPQVIIQEAAVEYVSVLAIDADVSVGDRISEGIITEIEWPAEAVTPNLIKTEDQPDAKQEFINALARTPMVAGETLTREKVIMAGDSGIMAAILKPGMRAVTVRISVDTAAGGFIQPGDKVDIILRENFQVRRPQNDTSTRTIERDNIYIAKTLFENVKVLAIDQTFTSGPENGAAIPGSTATFELSQPDAELLQESTGYGDIFLTLRGVNGASYKARSAARITRTEEEAAPTTISVFRAGEATPVAIQ